MKLAILSLLIFLTNSQITLAAAAEETSKDISSHKKVKVKKPEREEREKDEEDDEEWEIPNYAVNNKDHLDSIEVTPNSADEEDDEEALEAIRAALLHSRRQQKDILKKER